MQPPPLFRQRSRPVQVVLAVIAPLAFGALCGFMLGASQAWFNGLTLVAGLGGIGAGYEHATVREAALRGIVGGVLFTGALVAMFEARGLPPLAPLPAALPVVAAVYAIMGVPLGMLGGWLRSRSQQRATAG